jgi:magnesium transporter
METDFSASPSTQAERLFERIETSLDSNDPSALKSSVSGVHAADIADIYVSLDEQNRSRLIYALPPDVAAEVVALLDSASLREAVEGLADAKLTELASLMEPDDAADVLAALPARQRDAIIQDIPDLLGDQVSELMSYGEETAGGIMTKSLVSLPANATVAEAVEAIRESTEKEDLHYVYVVESGGVFFGLVPLRSLVLNERNVPLERICIPDPTTVRVNDDQEEVLRAMSKYDVAAAPVLDSAGRLLGRITHDDILDVVEEEAAEDMYHMAGLSTAEMQATSIMRTAGNRLSWLAPCLASMAVTAVVMMVSQQWFDTPALYSVLVIFVPMIAAIGGNCGVQIATVIVRGLSTGDLASSRFKTVFLRESRVALLMSLACGVMAAAVCRAGLPLLDVLGHLPTGVLVADSVNDMALAVGVGMGCAILVAAFLGMTLPFFFSRIRVDPAIASGPVVTTLNDIISVTIFLGLSSSIMAAH